VNSDSNGPVTDSAARRACAQLRWQPSAIAKDLPEIDTDTPKTSALEELPKDVKHAVDDAPGQVAAENPDQHLAGTFAPLFLYHDACRQRERQRAGEQPRRDLASSAGRVERVRESEAGRLLAQDATLDRLTGGAGRRRPARWSRARAATVAAAARGHDRVRGQE